MSGFASMTMDLDDSAKFSVAPPSTSLDACRVQVMFGSSANAATLWLTRQAAANLKAAIDEAVKTLDSPPVESDPLLAATGETDLEEDREDGE